MFFLLRMAFWLGVVCVLLPDSGTAPTPPEARISTVQAVTAAGAAVSDMRGFCGRQPEACEVGGKVAVALGHKAQAGARTLYDFITAQVEDKGTDSTPVTGSAGNRAIPVSIPASGTLTPRDLAPAWHAPVPLPRRREAHASRPSA